MSKIEKAISKSWIPISNFIFKNFYYKYDSTTLSVLFQIMARIHNFKGKTYCEFATLSTACSYFTLSKRPLLRSLECLQNDGIVTYKHNARGPLEIELHIERPKQDFTKLPLHLIHVVQSAALTPNAFSLYMFLIFKFCWPPQKRKPLSLQLNYLAKVIKSSTRTVKNSLHLLMEHNLVLCEFAEFQTQDPCTITPCILLDQDQKRAEQGHVATKQHKEAVLPTDKAQSNTNTLSDLERVLKRHGRDISDAPLIIKFLGDTSVALDKKPIKSIPALWEKDLQSDLKIYNFRFAEWKHLQEKEESKRYFTEEATTVVEVAITKPVAAVAQVDRSNVQFNAGTDLRDNSNFTTHQVETTFFSNKTSKISNFRPFFPAEASDFSNNQRDLNKRLKNHIRGLTADCDFLKKEYTQEEIQAIDQYKKDRESVRFLKTEDFIERYLSLGVELLRAGKRVNLDNINLAYSRQKQTQRG
ncbi:MAG: hypothetical protein HQK52_17000 [Oligoflexia bacterium]|nr:hypothetical protein [Oligoflexia bacterium]